MSYTGNNKLNFSLFDKCSGTLALTDVTTAGDSVQITLNDIPSDKVSEIHFLVQNLTEKEPFYLVSRQVSPFCFLLDLSPLKEKAVYGHQITFCFFIELCSNGQKKYYSLKEQTPVQNYKNYRIFSSGIWIPNPLDNIPAEYIGVVATKYNFDNLFCAAICNRNRYMELAHFCHLRSIRMTGGILKIKYDVNTELYTYDKTIIFFRSKLAEDAVSYDFKTISAKPHGNTLRITAILDLHDIEWKSLYWDVRAVLRQSQTQIIGESPIDMSTPLRIFLKFLYNGSYSERSDFFLYPYYTSKKTLSFVYRQKNEYDGLNIAFRELFAMLLYRIAKPYWKKQHICLVCEKFSSMAQDNGYYFFKHCMDNEEEKYLQKKIYYIITKDSPDRYKLEPYKDHILDFMSFRHLCYLLAADLIISSDSRYHTYPLQSRHSIFNRNIKKIPFVFLQHGVIALKRVDSFYGKKQKGGCDLFVVSTKAEKQIIVDNFGYEPREVINTGLPRWDVLHDKSQDKREIMIMPTWRNWLDSVPDEDFEQSDYFKHYMSLLNSKELADILEKYNMEVNFYLHAKFQEYSDQFKAKSDRINLISFGEVAVNEMLMRCRMLITDYSSVCWDVLYQDKPTLFYQFDLDKYDEAHGSYLDMRTELFGDRAENQEQLLVLLEEQIKNNFKLKPQYEELRKKYFQFKDQQHSRHICEAIKKELL